MSKIHTNKRKKERNMQTKHLKKKKRKELNINTVQWSVACSQSCAAVPRLSFSAFLSLSGGREGCHLTLASALVAFPQATHSRGLSTGSENPEFDDFKLCGGRK